MRDAILFASVTCMHFVCTGGLLLYVFGAGMARFDSGVEGGVAETLARWLLAALAFPVLTALERLAALRLPGLWGYIPFVINASVWGAAVVLARRRLRTLALRRRIGA